MVFWWYFGRRMNVVNNNMRDTFYNEESHFKEIKNINNSQCEAKTGKHLQNNNNNNNNNINKKKIIIINNNNNNNKNNNKNNKTSMDSLKTTHQHGLLGGLTVVGES